MTHATVFEQGCRESRIDRAVRHHWQLDPAITFPITARSGQPRVVLDRQTELRAQMEREPCVFFLRESSRCSTMPAARWRVLGADAEGLAFVPNATRA